MADRLVSVNDDFDFPAPVAERQAVRLGDATTAEGAAVAGAVAPVREAVLALPRTLAPVSAARPGNGMATVGDSTVVGGDRTLNSNQMSWPTYASIFSKQRLRKVGNFAVNGQTSAQVLEQISEGVIPANPAFCAIGDGRNDIATKVPLATYQANKRAQVALLRAAGIVPVLSTIVPVESPTQKGPTAQFNAWLKTYADSEGLILLDFYSILVDPDTGGWRMAPKYPHTLLDTGDGTGYHASDAGRAVMGEYAARILAPLLPPNSPLLAVDALDAGNLVPNGLMVNDENGDGVPDGATIPKTNPDNGARTLIVDPLVPGKMSRLEANGTTGTLATVWTVTQGFKAGDTMDLSAVVNKTLGTGGGATFRATCYGGPNSGDTYYPMNSLGRAIDHGVANFRFTIKPGQVSIEIRQELGQGTGIFDLGQLTLRNLTADLLL